MPETKPLRITLPPLQITLTDEQKVNLEWLTQQQPQIEDPTKKRFSDNWKRWIAENKLQGRSDADIVQVMVQNGIDAQLAKQAVNSVPSDPCFQAGGNFVQLLKKLESILEINRQLAELSPSFGKIERRSRLSRAEFLENYYAKNAPVIITEMMENWRAMSLWSPMYLKKHYGSAPVEIQTNRNSDPEYEINCNQHKKTVKMSDYVDLVLRGGETNDYYMVANNRNLEREDLKGLMDDIEMFPEFLDGSKIDSTVFFWFGPAGTITPLHHDPVNLMMAHVSGRKQWRLISPNQTPLLYNYIGVFSKVDLENPDYNKYPLFRKVKYIDVVLEPGEVIFIPVGWWHQVKALDTSIAVSFTNFVFPNQYNWKDPHITTW